MENRHLATVRLLIICSKSCLVSILPYPYDFVFVAYDLQGLGYQA